MFFKYLIKKILKKQTIKYLILLKFYLKLSQKTNTGFNI